jgi:hypothetical protein
MARWLRRMFVTGVAVSSIVGWAMLLDRAATAQTDPQVAEFLTSLNRSVTELPGQTGSQDRRDPRTDGIPGQLDLRPNCGVRHKHGRCRRERIGSRVGSHDVAAARRSATASGETRTSVEIPSNFLAYGRAWRVNVYSQRVPASLPTRSSGVCAAPEGSGLSMS